MNRWNFTGPAILTSQPLFYEKYFLYVNEQEKGFTKRYVLPESIDIKRMWLLEEGHCMRSQILNLCELKKQDEVNEKIHYESGSIETLKNIVDQHFGFTIIPELAAKALISKPLALFQTANSCSGDKPDHTRNTLDIC